MKRSFIIYFTASLALLASCGATTFDSTITNPVTPVQTVPAPTPTGTLNELLPQLVTTMTGLSSYIGPNKSGKTKSGKTEQLNLINTLWSAIETDLILADPSTAESLGRMVDLSTLAVTANHPADADKAAKFAGVVVSYFLNK
ncbi:MAG: hypothetical protein WCG40_02145 [Actinomycetes bacterium]